MALIDISRYMVLQALKEFDCLGREAMLDKFSSGPSGKSTRWYIFFDGRYYDQKLILRAAHQLSALGPLPSGRGTFKASEARRLLTNLGFDVVDNLQPDSGQVTTRSDDWREARDLIGTLYEIVDRLQTIFPGRKFTLDGHLVGSIGEVMAAYMFGLELLPNSSPIHDAVTSEGRKIQIKLTQSTKGVALRAQPDFLLVLCLTPERRVEIIYNGKGEAPWLHAGDMQKNGQRQISLKRLREIDAHVQSRDRIPQIINGDLAQMLA